MPKHNFPLDKIGTYIRKNDNDEEFPNWYKENKSSLTTSYHRRRPKLFFFFRTLTDAASDFYYSFRDLISGRRKWTSGIILASMLAGAGIGAVLGTFVFPALGTAIGGVMGGILFAGITAIGVFGLTVLGANFGNWLAKNIFRKTSFFSNEKKSTLSHRQLDKIKLYFHIEKEGADLISSYIQNRMTTVGKKNVQYAPLRSLQKSIIEPDVNASSLNPAVDFFKSELLSLLAEQKETAPEPSQLKQDIEAVRAILSLFTEEKVKEIAFNAHSKNKLTEFLRNPENQKREKLSHASQLSAVPHSYHPSSSSNPRSTPISNLSATPVAPSESFRQTKTTIDHLDKYFSDSENSKQYGVTPSKTKDSLILNIKLSEAQQYRVLVKNDSNGCLCFFMDKKLKEAKLSSEEFECFAEKMAIAFIAVAEPNTVIDLRTTSDDNQSVLYSAFKKALEGTSRFSRDPPPKVHVKSEIENKFNVNKDKDKDKLKAGG